MQIKEAIVARFHALCRERNIKYNELATRSGVTPSTVYSMMDNRRKDISVVTVKKLCDGLEITVSEFYSDPIFSRLEQEIH
ncbi:MAG: helix-turn-helix transcriptional regulator [Clostridia bacterium]